MFAGEVKKMRAEKMKPLEQVSQSVLSFHQKSSCYLFINPPNPNLLMIVKQVVAGNKKGFVKCIKSSTGRYAVLQLSCCPGKIREL